MKITGQMHFAKALQQLRKQGVELADVTSDELYGLAEAARRCADPFREVNADAAGFPVRVCEGVWFWKLTIGASVWLDEVTEMLGGGTSPRYRLAMIYALVHSREPEAFAGLDTERKIMRAVRATMRTIHATPEEVNRAVDVILDFKSLVPFEDGSLWRNFTPKGYVEGSVMFERKGKWYFMYSCGGWTRDDYCVNYSVGDTPFGPFEFKGKVLGVKRPLATGAGHHSVIRVGEDDWRICYHRRPIPSKSPHHRVVCIDRMEFDASGDIKPVQMTK